MEAVPVLFAPSVLLVLEAMLAVVALLPWLEGDAGGSADAAVPLGESVVAAPAVAEPTVVAVAVVIEGVAPTDATVLSGWAAGVASADRPDAPPESPRGSALTSRSPAEPLKADPADGPAFPLDSAAAGLSVLAAAGEALTDSSEAADWPRATDPPGAVGWLGVAALPDAGSSGAAVPGAAVPGAAPLGAAPELASGPPWCGADARRSGSVTWSFCRFTTRTTLPNRSTAASARFEACG
ncbi:hypothetical protein AB0J83_06795 [Actinoplanes sp. NPDC049596]|uniref:hypothetical protein n=1 Tax=unclassified Actinoplanes TaxID=2626549 RepID=UPI003418C09E